MKFEDKLSTLVRGGRNAELVGLMLRGLGENMTPQQVVDRIHDAHPDMTDAELRHAMATAEASKNDRPPSAGQLRIAKAAALADEVTEIERRFVEDTIAKCPKAGSKDLITSSPLDVSDLTPNEQAAAYVATVFPDDRHFVFTADEETKFHRRTYETLKYPSKLFRDMMDGRPVPNYAIANQFTGMADDPAVAISGDDFDTFAFTGEGSFACMKTLATRRLALLEFDALPLAEQARFWMAVIDGDLLRGRLRTLVYSGTKSIHALIRVDSAEIGGYHVDEYGENWVAELTDDPAAKWKTERARISRLTEFAADPKYRADRACKDPTRLTRFAGATRVHKDGTRRVQRLLWCAEPTDDDIPVPPDSGQTVFYTEGFGYKGEYYKC